MHKISMSSRPPLRSLTKAFIPKSHYSSSWSRPSYFSHSVKAHASPPNTNPATFFPMSQHAPATNATRKPFMEIALVVAVTSLAFLAIDNYRQRVAAEALLQKQQFESHRMQDLLTRQVNASRKKRELQILNERKANQIRQMKMALHVAMLRKQLTDNNVTPIGIDEVVQDYERCVKIDNSISNVSGTTLWVTDDSPVKAYVPNAREYDARDTSERK